jgi:putative transcriptional regulator
MENRIAEQRRARGLTQADLARLLAVSRQTVISIERGKYDPSLPLAFRMAATFGCRIEDLFTPAPEDQATAEAEEAVPADRPRLRPGGR